MKVLKDAEELKLLGHEVPGGWLCMVVLVGWLVGLLDVTKCWLSIWGCVKLLVVGYDDTVRPFKFAFET